MATQNPNPEGINFPLTKKGDRSTTETSKAIFSSSISKIDATTASNIEKESNWRNRYNKHLVEHVRKSLSSPKAALEAAEAGLEYLHNNFEFIREGKTYKLAEAMKVFTGSFQTGFIKGEKPKPAKFEYEVPYQGKILKGEALVKQLKQWAEYGTIEPSAQKAIQEIAQHPELIDLSNKYFVLLGAGSAMGPYSVLMSLGANVIAVDLDRPNIWSRLIPVAKASCGTLTFPLKIPQSEIKSDEDLYKNAGSNLITQAPEINNWLQTVYPDKQLIVGCYVYLDGEAHVKVALACDAIMKGMSESRKSSLAFLCTPTDCHVIPEEAYKAALQNYNSTSLDNLVLLPIKLLFGSKYLVKNAEPKIEANNKDVFYIVDGLIVPQGPNYALAKRLQHWRAIVARSKGCRVSSNVAPATATASVVHNRQFAWAYDGMSYFKPMEIFQQETSNAVMCALLIYDLNSDQSYANPAVQLRNPLELFSQGSFHGGLWRVGYKFNSIGEISVLIHFIKVLKPYFLISLIVLIISIFMRSS